MSRRTLRLGIVGASLLAVCAVAGVFAWTRRDTTAASAAAGGAPSATAATFADPFAYCAAAGDQLHPDSRYTGPAEPEGVVRALERALGSKPGTLDSYASHGDVYWRCLGGRVLGCFPGANLTCWEANTSRDPTPGEIQWCKDHPGDGSPKAAIPFVVTGHSTIYAWRCAGTDPAIAEQVAQVDAAGLITRIWYPLSP